MSGTAPDHRTPLWIREEDWIKYFSLGFFNLVVFRIFPPPWRTTASSREL